MRLAYSARACVRVRVGDRRRVRVGDRRRVRVHLRVDVPGRLTLLSIPAALLLSPCVRQGLSIHHAESAAQPDRLNQTIRVLSPEEPDSLTSYGAPLQDKMAPVSGSHTLD